MSVLYLLQLVDFETPCLGCLLGKTSPKSTVDHPSVNV